MGWLIALSILTVIGFIPLGGFVRYDSRGFVVKIIAGFLRITVFPVKKKTKKNKPQPAKQEKNPKQSDKPETAEANPQQHQQKPEGEENKGGKIQDFLPLVRIALDFLNQFRKMLCINHLQLKLILAGEDPCDLAVNYGRAWAALDNLLPLLEKVITIKKRDLEVECDFAADETRITAQAELTLSFWQMVFLGAVYGFQLIKELLIFKKKQKGGVINEPKASRNAGGNHPENKGND